MFGWLSSIGVFTTIVLFINFIIAVSYTHLDVYKRQGISSMQIRGFLPGSDGYDAILNSWNVMNGIMETNWFSERFEPRIRSYIWIQGKSDDWMQPEEYMENFLIVNNALRSSDFGFDYAFISNVASRFFRPNDAQERLAQAYDDIYLSLIHI